MQKLVDEGRPATDEEKRVLRKFSGWGGLGNAFSNPVYENRLRELLGDEAYEQAQMSRNSAYFTPAKIIDRLWDIAKALGFKGGNVLEGSAGIGKMIGLMPLELSGKSNIQAVEIDETTGNILKLLYPDAKVDIQGFEETKIPNGSVDLAITNVPFVTGLRVKDNTGDGDLSKKFGNIHDFCIAKNIRKLKEGGIGIFITSKGTLDDSQKLRDWIGSEGNADVVGAFRLNNETFGGTPVTSDIIIVRKRVNGQKSANAIDVSLPSATRVVKYDTGETKKMKNPETGRKETMPVMRDMPLDYNGYFIEHPENMGGEMAFNFEKDITFQPTTKSCFPSEGKNQDKLLDDWVKSIQEKDWSKEQTAETDETPQNNYEAYGEGVKEGSLILDSKGTVCIARYGQAVPLDTNDKKVKGQTKQQCLKDYQAVKNALNDVLEYQVNNEGDEGLQSLLDKLNKAFDQFVRKYGHLHGNTAISFLRNDVDFASFSALETYKEKVDKQGNKTPVYGKSDVFSKRVVEKEKEPQPTTIEDGVIASIYKYGGINIPYIAEQLGLNEEEAKKQILDKELGYENPDTMQVDVSYVYLSGNVRDKLRSARENNTNGKYVKNISALEKAVPADIPAHLIEFNLGSTWLDTKLYTDFFKEKTGKNVRCRNLNGGWILDIPDGYTIKESEGAVISTLCDKTIYTSQLIAAAMQGKSIKVQKTETRRDEFGRETKETITDKDATQACAARIEELKQEFKDWARAKMQEDAALAEETEKTYNEQFNNYAPLVIPKEFAPEHFGGQSKSITMRPHQSKAVIKGITQPVMFAHGVGAGKTFTLIATAMEMKRIGTAKKPMIVVQNATVGQFAESAKQLYPAAKILTMDEDHSEAARKAFYAKIKYNDWDMIIISQSVLDKIPDNPDRQIAFIRQKIDEKVMVLEQLRASRENGIVVKQMQNEVKEMEDEIADLVEQSRARQEKKQKRDEKKRAVAKQNAAVKAKEQLDRSVDDVEDFDDMDIDAILVDEAHGYKKLGFESVMTRVKGVDTGSSKKCASLFLKTRAVLEKSNGKNVVFATGTPVSNTAAEVWTFMRYLMPADVMQEYGIYYFDDFARNFGSVQQMLEFSTSGKFKENNRFAGYVNMPELARIWSSVADTVVVEDTKEVQEKLPKVEGGKATDIYLPQTRALRSIMKAVRQELERYENMSGKEKKRNSHIPLVAYGVAKAAAVDARLVDEHAQDDPNSKTNEAVRQTLKSLEETKGYNGTVAIFADNYQNKHSGFNLYQDIKKKLIEQGVPAEQIAIISGSPKLSDKKKLEIFDKVNKGEIRVVLGSTFTLGTGVNIQERLHTLIHIDAPNRPMDYTQRNGRIIRQGNLHQQWGIPVRVLRFGVEDSLDVTAYQRLKTKGAIADSVMKGDKLMQNAMDNRVLEEEEDTFGDTVAQLSGSEYAMLKNQAEKEVRKLEAKKKQHEADQIFIHAQLPRLKGQNKESEKRIEKLKESLAKVEEASKNGTTIEVGEAKYDSLDAMGEFFTNYNSKIREIETSLRKSLQQSHQTRELKVKINGIEFTFKTFVESGARIEKGKMVPFTSRSASVSCEELWGNTSFSCKGGYIKNGLEEILNETMTGNEFREAIETAQNSIERNDAQIKALEERQGREFAESEALQKAKDRLADYTQRMREEMEAKEAKYKEMDAEVEEAADISFEDVDDEEDGGEGGTSNGTRRYDEDIEEGEDYESKDSLSAFYDELGKKYNSAPVNVIESTVSDKELLETIADAQIPDGVSEEEVKAEAVKLRERLKKTGGFFNYGTKKITIFADRTKRKDSEKRYFHENLHGIFDMLYGSGKRGIAERFWNETPATVGSNDKGYVERNYPEEERAEEFLVRCLSEAMHEGNIPMVEQYLTDAGDIERINNILKELKYDRAREETERKGVAGMASQKVRPSAPRSSGRLSNHLQRIAEHVDALVEKLGTKERTKVYRSLDEVPEDERKHIEEWHRQGRKVRGWYENGEVHLFLPDIESEHQAEKTLWHETVAHHGLRQLIGDENLDRLLRHLWLEHRDGDMGAWVTKRMEQNGWRLNEAIEEYLAREAEEHPFEQPSLWQRLMWMLADVLHRMGFATDPTISDIQYLFWVSQNRLREGDALSKIKQQAFLHRLERAAAMTPHRQTYVNMYAEKVEDIYNPEAEGAYPDGETIRHSEETGRRHDEDIEEPLEVESAKDLYNERVDTAGFIVTEAYQDSMLALKTAQNAIVKDGEIPDSQNAYMAENLMHGKNKNEQDLFNLEYRDPIIDSVNEILNKMGWTMRRMNQYLLTKSGLERNRELFVRDWLERQRKTLPHAYEELNDDEQAIYDRKADKIETDFEDGVIDEAEKGKRLESALVEAHQEYIDGIENEWQTLKDHLYSGLKVNLWGYLKGLDAFIEGRIDDEYDPSKNDYSGLTEIYGGQFDDEEAINDVMNDEDAMELTPDGNTSGTVDKLWDKIHAASRYGLERYREAGMRSDEEIDKIEQMFHWYVPMRGFDKDTGEDMYQYFTSARKANSYVGGLIKRARGRKSRSKAPLASLFAMTYKAIGDCNQNLVNQHLYRLCQAHPNDLVVLSDAWAVLNETTGLWEEAYPTIPDDASAEEIRQITLAFEDQMRRKAVEGTAKKLNGKGRIDYAPADKKKRDEHIVEVRMNGRKKRMTFVGNPRAAQALNGHTRFERNHNPISNVNNWIKNKMAGAFTSFSPTFALRNMMRDWTHFRMMLGVREGQGYAHAAHKYYKETFPRPVHTRGKEGIKSLFKKYRAGTLDMNKEVERDFKDFMDNGGITGFVQMQKIEDIEKEMEKVNKQLKDGKAVKLNSKLWDFTLGAIEAYNEAIENNARFATYRASRHYAGRTKARSAYDAKEITVNFNRRGSGSKASGFKSERDKVVAAARAAGLTSQVFGEGRLFFNATVQAIATTFKNFKNPDGTLNKKYISRWAGMYALPPFAFGMLLPYINMALAAMLGGDDDDPYANLPDWVRRKNLCIYIGNDNFITIPVGQELSSFLALGDIAASRLYAPNLESADKSINEEIVDALNSFSPVDINTKVTKGGLFSKDWLAEAAGKTFSVLTPVISVASNRSWTGRPIFREDRFDSDKYTPEYQKVYSGTNQVLVDAMKKLHELGGGDDAMRGKLEVNPAIVQYLWEQYTGGPGKMFSNAISLGRDVKDLVTEGAAEDFNIRKVEGLKAFVQQGDDRTQYYRTLAKYRKYREDADKLYDAMNGYKKLADTDPTYYLKLEELSKGVDAVRMNIVREAEKELRKINKAANMAEGAERKELRRQYNEAVKEVVDMLDEVSL